ncbi:MAG: NAD(P)-dependent alcohol dehydrogenase [Myxococcales bacterium]|nr:NAD(P)-dependent alcohol dehydrogenase [Myxococcales bacterium]
MRAVVYERYGPPEVLHLAEVPTPEPRPDEVRVRVHAAGVSMSDHYIRSLDVPWVLWLPIRVALGFFRPRRHIPGIVYSGVVDRVGAEITKLAPGDAVYGMTGFDFGAYAEYKCLRTKDGSKTGCIALKPGNVSHEEATVAAYGGLLALQAIDHARIEAGDRVLIYGGSGTSGTMAIQIAKAMGAEVTGVASARNLPLLRRIGADHVIDYRTEAITDSGRRYDLILDIAGNRPLAELRRALAPEGRAVMVGGSGSRATMGFERTIRGLLLSPFVGRALRSLFAQPNLEDLQALAAWVESGALVPVVDRTFPLAEAATAVARVGAGHGHGKTVVAV